MTPMTGVKASVYAAPGTAHDEGGGHPERPKRVPACLEALEAAGRATETAPAASRVQLERVHSGVYLDELKRFCRGGGGLIEPSPTYAVPGSFEAAVEAAGATCRAVEDAWEGKPALALGRPPGHHAGPGYAMGFCLLNNVAVGAAQARSMGAERVMIVDFDVHHGNGTQDAFWADPSVLYLSIHQYPWYPGTGALEEVGEGPARGATVNVPLGAGAGDGVYLAAIDLVVAPAVRRFAPEVLLVSAGFDAHARDPLGLMEVTTEGFGAITGRLRALAAEVCGGRVALSLEGGYDLAALASSVLASLEALDGRVAGDPEPHRLTPELERAIAAHADGAA
ncbi:MAG: histone deacetylase family protein [Actinomycetota bacterium]